MGASTCCRSAQRTNSWLMVTCGDLNESWKSGKQRPAGRAPRLDRVGLANQDILEERPDRLCGMAHLYLQDPDHLARYDLHFSPRVLPEQGMREVGDAVPCQVALKAPAFGEGTSLSEVIQLASGQPAVPGVAGFVEHFMQCFHAGVIQPVLAEYEGVAIIAFIAIPHRAKVDHGDIGGTQLALWVDAL